MFEMKYRDLFLYCDVIVARNFEGLPELGHLSKKQLRAVKDVNKWWQLNQYTFEARRVWMTRFFEMPMNLLKDLADMIYSRLDRNFNMGKPLWIDVK